MTVLDLGCGPGFFSIEMAKITGLSGKVVAADLQEGMLEIVEKKIRKKRLTDIVKLHKCSEKKIGLAEKFDFILIFYVVHEVTDQSGFIDECSPSTYDMKNSNYL
jgi:ubiquinone/menaquinone biosynthesis C-methylase UbiE